VKRRQEPSSITLHMAFISFTPLSLLLIAAAISIDVAGSFIIASYNYPSLPRIALGSYPFIHSSTSSSSTTAYHPYSYLTSYCASILPSVHHNHLFLLDAFIFAFEASSSLQTKRDLLHLHNLVYLPLLLQPFFP